MSFPEFGVHGGGDPSGGILVLLDQVLERLAGGGGDNGGSFELFPGLAELSWNIHPMIVHFPIAMLTGYFLMDVLGLALRKAELRLAARWMLYLGAVGSAAAAAAGWYAAQRVPHGGTVHEVMVWHGRIGLTVAGLASVLAVWRWIVQERLVAMALAFQILMSAILMAALALGADLGGWMVYGHGVGVHRLDLPDEHHHHGSGDGQPGAEPAAARER